LRCFLQVMPYRCLPPSFLLLSWFCKACQGTVAVSFLNLDYNTATFKGVSNTSSLSISFNSHSGASAGFCQRENVLPTIGTDYHLHECLELRQSGHLLNAYQDPVQTWSYLEYSCLVVFKDIVRPPLPVTAVTVSENFPCVASSADMVSLPPCPHQAPASRTFRL